MNESIKKMKSVHKELASRIREYKSYRKQKNADKRPDGMKESWRIDSEVHSLSQESRARHIAYCMNRGVEYEKIEQPRKQNSIGSYGAPSWKKIDEYRELYRGWYESANVCTSEQTA